MGTKRLPVSDFKILRISQADAELETDQLRLLRWLLQESEEMYPGIDLWFKRKVVPGLKDSSRCGFIGLLNDQPMITAIVKKGVNSKFCHLKIENHLQESGLGELFFTLMALEVRRFADEVHFTLPESLWCEQADFFRSFGFLDAQRASTQYRLFDEELRCQARFSSVWEAALTKLVKIGSSFTVNKLSLMPDLLLSVQPKFADKIISGTKRVEIRRRFSPKWMEARVAIYSSSPVKSLIGEATITNIERLSPDTAWRKYRKLIGGSEHEYWEYASSSDEVFAIYLDAVVPYAWPIPLFQIEQILDEHLTPPQSYRGLENTQEWSQAVSIATLLHGNLARSHKPGSVR